MSSIRSERFVDTGGDIFLFMDVVNPEGVPIDEEFEDQIDEEEE